MIPLLANGDAGLKVFQIIVLPILLLATCFALWQWLVHRKRRLAVATLVLTLAMVGVADPALTTKIASYVGIGRGTDLIVYLTAFALIAITFFMLAVQRRQRLEITELTRQLALRELPAGSATPARDAGAAGPSDRPEPA